jgi:hypothetical protein
MNAATASRLLLRAALPALVCSLVAVGCGGDNNNGGPCVDSDCTAPPDDFCDGNRSIQFEATGICGPENECVYTRAMVECAFSCDEGRCVTDTDPCEGIDCSTIPEPTCDGNIRVAFTGAGDCELGTCEYPEGRQNCADQGLFCVNGECTTADCAEVTCDEPPDAFCEEHDIAVAYGPRGSCFEGNCSYNEIRTDCDALSLDCADGECVERCEGVVCDAPPSGSCDELGRAVSYEPNGVCDHNNGGCIYAEVITTCDVDTQACSFGRCVAVCSDGICDNPPSAFCDAANAVSFLAESECDAGECVYSSVSEDCGAAGGDCRAGVCLSTCGGRVCNAAPADRCDAGNVAVSYADRGTCVEEECTYVPVTTDCDDTGEVCQSGECVAPCTGVTCNTPPTPTCDGDTRHYFVTPGTCFDGECDYEERTLSCRDFGLVCVSGDCIDVCESVSCFDGPDDDCDGSIRLDYPFVGTCDFGECAYEPNREDCRVSGEVCADGACTDLCTGVDCSTAPAAYCDSNTAVRPQAPGICREGTCDFVPFEENCSVRGLVCRDGLCRQPCFGVTCDDPPPAYCDGTTAVVSNAAGTCSAGACSYSTTRTNCAVSGLSCVAGACVDLCDGQLCYTPPSSECDGNVAVRYDFFGQCNGEGGCDYGSTREDCSLTGSACDGGTCVNTCEGTCDTPPDATCDGNTRVRFSATGVCTGGVCDYTETRFDCTSVNELCRDGACFDPCLGLACGTPPLAVCEGTTAVRYESPGICIFGVCGYDEVRRNCAAEGLRCAGGLCESACGTADDCSPPDAFCDGDTLVSPVGAPTCAGGACLYGRQNFDCRSIGETCDNGACTDLCNGVDCSVVAPPADVCQGNIAVDYDRTATCDLGECIFGSARVDCTDYATVCLAGVCVD